MTTTLKSSSRPCQAPLAIAASWLVLTALLPQPGWSRTSSLDFPSDGVVCDRGSRICYDRQGPSLALTRREYGQRSEQNLLRQLSGRPISRDIRFSSGEVCDLRGEICWDDGWGRTNVSKRLSRQLFGDNGGWTRDNDWRNNTWRGNPGNSSWGQTTAQDSGFCELSQRGRRIFYGNCNLQQRYTPNGTAYLVDFRNGRSYSFYNRRGQLVMVDGTGTWPVSYNRNGDGGEFRWGDLQLVARQNRSIEPGYNTGASAGLLQDLINSPFR